MHPYLKKLVQNFDIDSSDKSALEPLLEQVSAYLNRLEKEVDLSGGEDVSRTEKDALLSSDMNIDRTEVDALLSNKEHLEPQKLAERLQQLSSQYERQITQLAAVKLGLEDSYRCSIPRSMPPMMVWLFLTNTIK